MENTGDIETVNNQVHHLAELLFHRGSSGVGGSCSSDSMEPKICRNKSSLKKTPLLAPRPVKIPMLDQPDNNTFALDENDDKWATCLPRYIRDGDGEDVQSELNKIFCGTSHSSYDCFDNSYGILGSIGADSFDSVDQFGWPDFSNKFTPVMKYERSSNLDDLPKLGVSPKPAILDCDFYRPPSRAPNPFQAKNVTERVIDDAFEIRMINADTFSPPPFSRNRSCSEPVIWAPIRTNIGL